MPSLTRMAACRGEKLQRRYRDCGVTVRPRSRRSMAKDAGGWARIFSAIASAPTSGVAIERNESDEEVPLRRERSRRSETASPWTPYHSGHSRS